jgi:hypothetical protein
VLNSLFVDVAANLTLEAGNAGCTHDAAAGGWLACVAWRCRESRIPHGSEPGIEVLLTSSRRGPFDILRVHRKVHLTGSSGIGRKLFLRFCSGKLEAPPGFEPGMEVLQTSALPLGDGAD